MRLKIVILQSAETDLKELRAYLNRSVFFPNMAEHLRQPENGDPSFRDIALRRIDSRRN
jgi:hypothetical protein